MRLFRPSALEVARLSDAEVVIGTENSYNWIRNRITLVRDVALSREPHCVLIAAHELGHSRQPRWVHWLGMIPFARWWREAKAWDYAIQWFADQRTFEIEWRPLRVPECAHRWETTADRRVTYCALCGLNA